MDPIPETPLEIKFINRKPPEVMKLPDWSIVDMGD
jgi:hypothetical protein